MNREWFNFQDIINEACLYQDLIFSFHKPKNGIDTLTQKQDHKIAFLNSSDVKSSLSRIDMSSDSSNKLYRFQKQ